MKLSCITEWTQAAYLLKAWQRLSPLQLRDGLRKAIEELDRLGDGPEYYEHLAELQELGKLLAAYPQRQLLRDELAIISTLTQALPPAR